MTTDPLRSEGRHTAAPEDVFESVELPKGPAELASTARRRREWARHALMASVSLGAAGSFLAVSRTLHTARSNAFDRAVMHAFARRRSGVLNGVVRDVTALGSVTVASVATAAALFVLRRSRPGLLQVALGALGGLVAELGIKRHYARPRPTVVPRLQEVTSYSYPSGHSIAASCVYLTIAFVASRRVKEKHTRTLMLGAASGLASTVGATRVYLGVHYPTDVLGGLALGTAWACLVEAVFDYTGAHRIEVERRAKLVADGSVGALHAT